MKRAILLVSMAFAGVMAAGASGARDSGEEAAPLRLAAASTTPEAAATASEQPAEVATPEARARARDYFTDLAVRDQDGRVLRFYSDVLEGRVVVINFMFTNCTDACPMATQKMKALAADLGDRFGREVFFVSISVDPGRDSVSDMRAFAEKQGALMDGWVWLTGEPQNLTHIVQKFGAYTDDVNAHSTLMLVGNVPRAHWAKIPPMSSPRHIAAKLALIMGEL